MNINEIELASILADIKLSDYAQSLSLTDYRLEFPNGLIVDVSDDETAYTEEAQDMFNEFYDEYLTLIEQCQH